MDLYAYRIESGKQLHLNKAKTVDSTESTLAQAKILKAVENADNVKHLKHVDAPKDGVSDAIKQQFLEERKEGMI